MKEPRKVLYEDKDVVSAVSYSLSENQDKESANVGDTTDMLERTENGWCIVTGVCIVFFLYAAVSQCSSWVCFIWVSGTKYESKEGDRQFQQREISSVSGEKVSILYLSYVTSSKSKNEKAKCILFDNVVGVLVEKKIQKKRKRSFSF